MSEFFLHSFNTLSHGLIGYAIPFLFVLTIVVFFHELGHFLVARWAGVKVLTFSLGFGPELAGFNDRHGTRWKISAIPLGGYVKFFGDESEASTPSSETLSAMTEEERAGSFHHKKVGPRAAIVAAGPIANFLLAIVIFTCLFTFFGKPSTTARVDKVEAGSAADNSSLQIQGTPQLREVKDSFGNVHRLGVLGITRATNPGDVVTERVDPATALWLGVKETWFVVERTMAYIGGVFTGREAADQVGGPIRIAQISGQVATIGVAALVHLAAVLSISIGLLNLFPVPLLDGGHLLFYAVEAVRGRPLSDRAQEMGFRIGLGLVLMLMVFATYNDILHLAAS
jgi:regulator of sigma E protease